MENKMKSFKISPVIVIQTVYDLSNPQGMGFLHAENGELSIEDAKQCIFPGVSKFNKPADHDVISMDYVKGRSCKFHANIYPDPEGGFPFVKFDDEFWYDHSKDDMIKLLRVLERNCIRMF
jgi:hypothetical protein